VAALNVIRIDFQLRFGIHFGQTSQQQVVVGHLSIGFQRSRGIEQDAAQTMIIHAFAAELTEALENEVLRQAWWRRGCT
jgi:hypothetical protein